MAGLGNNLFQEVMIFQALFNFKLLVMLNLVVLLEHVAFQLMGLFTVFFRYNEEHYQFIM